MRLPFEEAVGPQISNPSGDAGAAFETFDVVITNARIIDGPGLSLVLCATLEIRGGESRLSGASDKHARRRTL